MSTSISTSLTVTNAIDAKVEAFKALVQQYVSGVPNIYKGVRHIGDESIAFPCLMIQPVDTTPKMRTTGKFETWYTLDIYWYVASDNAEECEVMSTDVGEILQKLMSNNALGDLNTAGQTNQFKTYSTNWVDSEMSKVQYSPVFLYGDAPGKPKYAAVGHLQLRLQTQAIK